MMGGKNVEGNEKRKVQDKRNVRDIFSPRALFNSGAGEVKRAEDENWTSLSG